MAQPIDLDEHIRDIPDFPKPGILFKDITPLLQHPAAFQQTIDRFTAEFAEARIDKVLCVESRGFLFGAPLALALRCGLSIIRKQGKLPWKTRSVEYALEYGTDIVEMHEDAIGKGERVLLIDDLLATGGTAEAGLKLIGQYGADCVACAFVVELDFLKGRERLAPVPTFALLHYCRPRHLDSRRGGGIPRSANAPSCLDPRRP